MKIENIKFLILVFVLSAMVIVAGFYAYKRFYTSKETLPFEIDAQTIDVLKEDGDFLKASHRNQSASSTEEGDDFLPEGFFK